MATHSNIPAWRIPWTEEPGGLQSRGSQSQIGLSREQAGARGREYCTVFGEGFTSGGGG